MAEISSVFFGNINGMGSGSFRWRMHPRRAFPKKREGGLLPGGDSQVAIARRKSRPPGTTNEIFYRIVLEVRTPVRSGSTLSA